MKNIKAFTLVELIVVITILAVLGTIAFVSFQGYAVSSRDSARLSNLKVTQKALQYYFIENSIYPEPSKGTAITFSGAEVWTQGTIGESVVQKIKRLTSVPTDPLTGSEITYSRLNTKTEVELATTFERGLTLDQTSNVYAGETQGIAYIVGDYNGLVAKVSTGSSVYVLAVPSIINGDISVDDYSSLMGSNKLSVQGKNVIPASYTGTTFDSDNTYDLGITNLVVYSGSTLPTTQTELNTFITTLQDTYSGSTIQDVSEIGVLVQTTEINDLLILGSGLLQNNLAGESVELTQVVYSCAANPGYSNANFVEGTPTISNTPWQNTNNTNPCYYECNLAYGGNDCSIAPHFTLQSGSYGNGGNGIVYDPTTLLEWQADGIISGQMNWDNALTYCENSNLGGYNNWRLPSVNELYSLINIDSGIASIYPELGEGTTYEWTSITNGNYDYMAYSIDIRSGRIETGNKTATDRFTRCVRGTSNLAWLGNTNGYYDSYHHTGTNYIANNSRFTNNGNGTISDSISNLMWEKDDDVNINSKTSYSWVVNYCNNLTLGGYTNWRLPNIKELLSITDYSRHSPNLHPSYFTSMNFQYWTSSNVNNLDTYLAIYNYWGRTFNASKNGDYYYRCTRDI